MDYPLLDQEFFIKLLAKELPKLLAFVDSSDLFDIQHIMRLTGYSRKWKELESSLDDAISWLSGGISKKEEARIGLCPAGGFSAEFICALEKNGIPIRGVIDSFKAKTHETYNGLSVYPMKESSLKQFKHVMITSPAYSEAIFEALFTYRNGEQLQIHAPFLRDPFDRAFCEKSIKTINDICSVNRGGCVVYAVDRLYFHNVKRVKALSENGMKVILLTPDPLAHHSHPLDTVSDVFEWICCTHNSLLNLLFILNRIFSDIIHLSPVAHHYESAVLMHAVSKVPVVCEFYDILLSLHTHKEYVRLFGKNAAEIQFFCEHYLCNKADGIIYKSSEEEGSRLLSYHSSDKPSLQFQNYIVGDEASHKVPERKSVIHIVYEGGVHSKGTQNSESSLLQPAKDITRQGLFFDIYNVNDMGDGGFEDYESEAERNAGFSYHRSVNTKEIVPILSHYDFGWIVIDVKNSKMNRTHFQTAINAKFFDYISAGIPVIVGEEFGYMAEITQEHDIGVVISFNDIPNIGDILSQYSIHDLKENVKNFRNQWSMENHIHRLIGFYTSLMRQPHLQRQSVKNHSLAS